MAKEKTQWRFGQRRQDGYRFKCLNKRGVEEWLSPDAFERHCQRKRRWHKDNRDRVRKNAKAFYARRKLFFKENPEEARKFREKTKARQRLWKLKHRDKVLASARLKRRNSHWTKVSLASAKSASRLRGHGIPEITRKDLLKLWRRQGGRCYWSGIPMATQAGTLDQSLDKVSIDRLDPNCGYSLQNCVLACWAMNRARGKASITTFQAFLEKLRTHSRLFSAG